MKIVTDQATGLCQRLRADSTETSIPPPGRPWERKGTTTAIATTTRRAQAPVARCRLPPRIRAKGAVMPAARAAPALSIAMYRPGMSLSWPGKSRFTMPGMRTFAIATPVPISKVPTKSPA